MARSSWLLRSGAGALPLLLLAGLAGPAQAFGLDDVANRARMLAAQPYQSPSVKMPPELAELDYDAYRNIRYRPEKALWRNDKLPFELMFFVQGRAVPEPVRVNVVEPHGVQPLAFDPGLFDFGRNKIDAKKLGGVGFNGFRVHYAVNKPGYKDEVLVFQGASYFRAVGKGQSYGLSARGLAVDTAAAEGEEFPRFVEFWIERPKATASSLVIHALLDSRRVTGAYRFIVTPGAETTMQVTTRLYARAPIAKIGIASLTSMYAFGENQPGRDDFRPEVHDSDGLSIQSAEGEWIWRPLVNPRRLLVTSFALKDPRGFGLMQRDRNVASYEDPEAVYERRPSVWVEPTGRWGPGRIELVQIPAPDETNDNIVAYWVPQAALAVGKPLEIAYRLRWQLAGTTPANLGWVVQTRRGRGFVKRPDGDINFVIDFDGPALRALPADAELEPVIWTDSNAQVHERNLFKNAVTGAWRMTVRFKRADAARPVELRAYMRLAKTTLTETWSYVLPAEPDKP
ncbi:MAG: glucan biosynthesis protein G [Pseudomonadota bacterium]|nr:glucan biosynthesis protein G [Pseudomonadota bacterium]